MDKVEASQNNNQFLSEEVKKQCYVYLHKKTGTNDVFYIGMGWVKNHKRAYDKKSRSLWWKNIVEKYGFDVEIKYDNIDVNTAWKYEKELIKYYGRLDLETGCLVNLTDGGDGTVNISNEAKEKLRLSKLGKNNPNFNKHPTEETRQKMRDRSVGDKNPFFNKTHTEEARKKMSNKQSGNKNPNFGRIYTNEQKEAARIRVLGKKNPMFNKTHSQEARKEISSKLREYYKANKSPMLGNHNNPMLGKHHSIETIINIRKNNRLNKSVAQIDKNGNIVGNYISIRDAGRLTCIAHQSINACVKGRRKSAGGFMWKYTTAL